MLGRNFWVQVPRSVLVENVVINNTGEAVSKKIVEILDGVLKPSETYASTVVILFVMASCEPIEWYQCHCHLNC